MNLSHVYIRVKVDDNYCSQYPVSVDGYYTVIFS